MKFVVKNLGEIGADFHTNCFFVGGIVGDEGGEIGGELGKN